MTRCRLEMEPGTQVRWVYSLYFPEHPFKHWVVRALLLTLLVTSVSAPATRSRTVDLHPGCDQVLTQISPEEILSKLLKLTQQGLRALALPPDTEIRSALDIVLNSGKIVKYNQYEYRKIEYLGIPSPHLIVAKIGYDNRLSAYVLIWFNLDSEFQPEIEIRKQAELNVIVSHPLNENNFEILGFRKRPESPLLADLAAVQSVARFFDHYIEFMGSYTTVRRSHPR